MIYIVSFFVGILNSVFAAGSGQVLVVYLIYFLKMKTHKVRALSVAVLSISSIFAIFGYKDSLNFKLDITIILVLIACVTGIIGTKLMKKISANILNLISGILLVCLTIFKFFQERGI